MESQVVSIIVKAFDACAGWLEDLIVGVPGAKTAIFWAIFVSLIMSFFIVPLRGFGRDLGVIDFTVNTIHNEKASHARTSKRIAEENKRNSYSTYKANRQRREDYAKRYKRGE